MQISKDIKIKDLALIYKDNLILTDLHIGYEEALNKQGLLIPRLTYKELEKKIINLLKLNPKTIIINGDLKHEFGSISKQEWKNTNKILKLLTENRKVILIKGNHDKILEPLTKDFKLEIKDYHKIDNILITHGDKIIKEKAKIIIIGHEHPAISFKERPDEKFKCFLKTKYKNSILIVQPSLNLITKGSDITKEKILSPYIKNLKNSEVFIPEKDKVLYFGKLSNI